jgi:hypothetical protein
MAPIGFILLLTRLSETPMPRETRAILMFSQVGDAETTRWENKKRIEGSHPASIRSRLIRCAYSIERVLNRSTLSFLRDAILSSRMRRWRASTMRLAVRPMDQCCV